MYCVGYSLCEGLTYALNFAILFFQCSSSAVGPMSSASFLIFGKKQNIQLDATKQLKQNQSSKVQQ